MAAEPLAMAPNDEQRGSPMPPRVDDQYPKQSISVTELGTFHVALEHRQL